MRLLAVSDLHYRLRHYDWLLYAADDVDVVSMAGDLADVANPVPLEVQVVVLDSCLERPSDGAVVLAASGNHDLDAPGPDGEQPSSPTAAAATSTARGSPWRLGGTAPSSISTSPSDILANRSSAPSVTRSLTRPLCAAARRVSSA